LRRVLVCEDDERMRYAVARALERDGFSVEEVADGEGALEAVRRERFAVVVLDWELPDVPGIDVCKAIRVISTVPVIMLTARNSEVDRVLGLELGADDYLTKPFSMAELRSRIRAVLRRQQLERSAGSRLEAGQLRLDPERHTVEMGGRPVKLTPTEFRLLALLIREDERVLSRNEIMRHLWESAHVGDERTVDTHVRNLRRKIEADPENPSQILSVRGVGYRFRPA
jgi:two-component system response regulator RegX3